jgi:hypothetical protein
MYRGHSDVVHSVAWSPDGQQIASCSHNSTRTGVEHGQWEECGHLSGTHEPSLSCRLVAGWDADLSPALMTKRCRYGQWRQRAGAELCVTRRKKPYLPWDASFEGRLLRSLEGCLDHDLACSSG